MNYSFLFDQDNNLIGAFVFGKTSRQIKATDPSDLNERMLKAAMAGNTAAVVELVAKGADVNAKGKYSDWTPLILASKKGEIELVNYLLTYGADVNVESGVRIKFFNANPNLKGITIALLSHFNQLYVQISENWIGKVFIKKRFHPIKTCNC